MAALLPLLLIAEPMHFLIELPEHFGLNTQTDPDVLVNTRTVAAGPFLQWFTNGNNLHTAHHYHQGVPMTNMRELQKMIDGLSHHAAAKKGEELVALAMIADSVGRAGSYATDIAEIAINIAVAGDTESP